MKKTCAGLAVLLLAAGCAIRTGGSLTLDGDRGAEPAQTADGPVDASDVTEGQTDGTEVPCTSDNQCGAGKYCCSKNGIVGCYEDTLECDCAANPNVCLEPKKCCQKPKGTWTCQDPTVGCYCSGIGDTACKVGEICCMRNEASDFTCVAQGDSTGCFCTGAPAGYCGPGSVCCVKESQAQCYPDNVGCACDDATGCLPGQRCCQVGGKSVCTPDDGGECICRTENDCGAGKVCCNLPDLKEELFCRDNMDGCLCSGTSGVCGRMRCCQELLICVCRDWCMMDCTY